MCYNIALLKNLLQLISKFSPGLSFFSEMKKKFKRNSITKFRLFFLDEVKAWKSQTSISDLDFEFNPTSFNHMLGSIIDLVDEAGLFDNLKTSNQLIFSSDIVTQSSLEFQEYIKYLLINKLINKIN